MSKGIAILGSTGSIGSQSLQVVDAFPEKFHVVALAAGKNVETLRTQIRTYQPRLVSVVDNESVPSLREEFPNVEIVWGAEGLKYCVTAAGVQAVVVGVVGFAALAPTLEAIRAGKDIALANKEVMVVAGELLRREIGQRKVRLIPVDSEHNAIFQLLEGRPLDQVESLVLTASGGPLFRIPEFPLGDVTPEMAVKHPKWNMGPKISVDSATLMNKGLEIIEAHYLFDFPQEAIEIWIHPQSLVHGAICLKDHSFLAQMNIPDMKCSIGHALAYPERLPRLIQKLGWKELRCLEFFEPDATRFPALNLARSALKCGPSHLIALNAGNEVAVYSFLEGKILFSQITPLLDQLLESHSAVAVHEVEDIYEVDRQARNRAKTLISGLGSPKIFG